MASEATTWSECVRPVLVAARLDPHRIENVVGYGMPDVNYKEGWIELKYVDEWPKRPTTPLRLPKFYPQQRVWLRRRWRMKGHAWLLLRVHPMDFFLFEGEFAALRLGYITKTEMVEHATVHSQTGFTYDPFVKVLTTPRT